jgi:Uroporphyrinogen decarboxylase (URO-D)
MQQDSPKTNLLKAIYHEAPSHVPFAGEDAYRLVDHVGRKPPREGRDEWGVVWAPLPAGYELGPAEPAESYAVEHPARSVGEALALPLPPSCVGTGFAGLFDRQDGAQTLLIGQHGSGLLDRFILLLGMQKALVALVAEPEAAAVMLERIADYHVAVARCYLTAGSEAAWLADDYAGSDGPYLRPALWRRLILPQMVRVIAVYRGAGVPVFFHTCGRAEAFVGDLLDAGVTVFSLQSEACDLGALRARYGRRIAFIGGIPSGLMLTGRPEDVRGAARAAIERLGRDGGLILAPDQPLAFPAANEAALAAAAQEFGAYG